MAIIAEFAEEVGCATPLFTLTQPVYARSYGDGAGRAGYGVGVRSIEEDHRHGPQTSDATIAK